MNRRTIAADALVAVALAASITVVIGTIESVSHVANISNPYIIGIAILASRRGLYPALVASALALWRSTGSSSSTARVYDRRPERIPGAGHVAGNHHHHHRPAAGRGAHLPAQSVDREHRLVIWSPPNAARLASCITPRQHKGITLGQLWNRLRNGCAPVFPFPVQAVEQRVPVHRRRVGGRVTSCPRSVRVEATGAAGGYFELARGC